LRAENADLKSQLRDLNEKMKGFVLGGGALPSGKAEPFDRQKSGQGIG
jgi:hypothetical protein